ncbi:MAG: hypothetical protein O3B42_07960 [Actinomycetota bacterium]|nr:hypothetical protein [Actinomycetota bacterium]
MSEPRDPYQNPPGWTDPYAESPATPPGTPFDPSGPQGPATGPPPGSPLLTGLILGLLLVALSVAVFQLFGSDDPGTAAPTTSTTAADQTSSTTTVDSSTTTSTTVPSTDPYEPVDPPIPADTLKMITDGLRVNDTDIPDIVFGQAAETAIGRLVASFGQPDDTGWQTSTGQWGVCAGDLERILQFGTFAAIVTRSGGSDIFNGYRSDINYGDITEPPATIETLSGLTLNDTVADLQSIYASQRVFFVDDASLGSTFVVESLSNGTTLLWGPVQGEEPTDRIVGIYAPDVCSR